MLHGIMCICCGAIMADAHAGGKHPDGASAPLCVECVEAVMDGFRLHVVAVMVNKIIASAAGGAATTFQSLWGPDESKRTCLEGHARVPPAVARK